jgi:quercetin dioxygenase-like cupin family protein
MDLRFPAGRGPPTVREGFVARDRPTDSEEWDMSRGVKAITVLALSMALPLAWPRAGTAQESHGFGRCVPVSERARPGDVGCFIVAESRVGRLGPLPVFWHVTRFGSRGAAEWAARTARGASVLDAFGATWLLAIGPERWRPAAGLHVVAIGPLPVQDSVSYAALYLEASMQPGAKSGVHRHSGPEAWYTLSGETCLETPNGTSVGRSDGSTVIVPGGVPMELTATGTTTRRSLVLILHDVSEAPTTMVSDWTPSGKCASAASGGTR